MALTGNDIVDLSLTKNKHNDKRFLDRVFTPNEKKWIFCQKNKNKAVWKLWSAKEAIYKIQKKLNPIIYFSPISIDVLKLQKQYNLSWLENSHLIHCLASNEPIKNHKYCIKKINDEGPRKRSLAVRSLIQRYFREKIIITKNSFNIPQIIPNIGDISLTHDGSYVAFSYIKNLDKKASVPR